MAVQKFDVAVIGGGPGGYVAAIRCAQLGLRTVCIDNFTREKDKASLGGTCLNVGCIPSKALLDSSEHYYTVKQGLKSHGIKVGSVGLDLATLMGRKKKVVDTLTGGISALFLKNKVTSLFGTGRLVSEHQIEVRLANDETSLLEVGKIIIATGSSISPLPDVPFDHDKIVDSTDALSFDAVPKRLGIIGAGAISLELGSVWSRLGSKVTIMQRRDRFLPVADQDVAKHAYKALLKQGLDIRLGLVPVKIKATAKQVSVSYVQDGEEQKMQFDKLLVATGRIPNTLGLNAEAIGIRLDDRGFIEVNEFCQTNRANIFAIGDVVRGPMLAHKASEEGIMVAERIGGQQSLLNYRTIPSVIYTHPEMAWVGQTEQQLQVEKTAYRVGSFPFKASGRAHAMGSIEGLVKILVHDQTDVILGVHILGPNASELISEAVLAMEYNATAEDIALTMHAHPTLSEAVHEAALAAGKRAIHI